MTGTYMILSSDEQRQSLNCTNSPHSASGRRKISYIPNARRAEANREPNSQLNIVYLRTPLREPTWQRCRTPQPTAHQAAEALLSLWRLFSEPAGTVWHKHDLILWLPSDGALPLHNTPRSALWRSGPRSAPLFFFAPSNRCAPKNFGRVCCPRPALKRACPRADFPDLRLATGRN